LFTDGRTLDEDFVEVFNLSQCGKEWRKRPKGAGKAKDKKDKKEKERAKVAKVQKVTPPPQVREKQSLCVISDRWVRVNPIYSIHVFIYACIYIDIDRYRYIFRRI